MYQGHLQVPAKQHCQGECLLPARNAYDQQFTWQDFIMPREATLAHLSMPANLTLLHSGDINHETWLS